jgi:hypothetical protein
MRYARLPALGSSLCLGGCMDQLLLSPEDEWGEARARWEAPGPSRYTFEVRGSATASST